MYSFNELTTLIQYGLNLPAIPKINLNDISYLRITDINEDGTINFSNLKTCNKNLLSDKHILNTGDILIARAGSVGKSYYYEYKVYGYSTFATNLIRFVVNKNLIQAKYFFFLTKTINFTKMVSSISKKSAQPAISAKLFSEYKVNVPSIKIQ